MTSILIVVATIVFCSLVRYAERRVKAAIRALPAETSEQRIQRQIDAKVAETRERFTGLAGRPAVAVAPRPATTPPEPPRVTPRPCGCKDAEPQPVIIHEEEEPIGWLCPTCLADVPDPATIPKPRQVTRTPPGEPHPDTHEWETIEGWRITGDTITVGRRQRYAADGVSPPTGEPTDVYGRRMDAADVLDEVKAKVNHVRTGRGVGPDPRDEIRAAIDKAKAKATAIADGFEVDEYGVNISKSDYEAYVSVCNDIKRFQAALYATPEYVVS